MKSGKKSISWSTYYARRRFTYIHSLPKVAFSTLKVFSGLTKVGCSGKPTVLVFSICEDYARLWYYFARKFLGSEKWEYLIVDCAGDLDPKKFDGCHLIRFINLYHGIKIGLMMKHVITSDIILLSDDDRYLVKEVTADQLNYFQDPNTAAVSLRPRSWWRFNIDGKEYLPMGTYALLFRRSIFLQHQLDFKPQKQHSTCKVFPPGVKQQMAYDSADYANEQLLKLGYKIVTLTDQEFTLGYDGLGGKFPLMKLTPKPVLQESLLQSKHFKRGSGNGAVIRALYGHLKTEKLYQAIFHEAPKFKLDFSEGELYDIVEQNQKLSEAQRQEVRAYFEKAETTYQTLVTLAQQ